MTCLPVPSDLGETLASETCEGVTYWGFITKMLQPCAYPRTMFVLETLEKYGHILGSRNFFDLAYNTCLL